MKIIKFTKSVTIPQYTIGFFCFGILFFLKEQNLIFRLDNYMYYVSHCNFNNTVIA